MFLVELVVQGVRGFRELVRLRFQGGFNLVVGGNESGKTAAADALVRLLYPSNQPGAIDALVSRATPDASRGAVVVYANDNSYYRVIQDFSKRAVNLSQYHAATKEFTVTQKDWESAETFMAGMTAGVTEEEYRSLFLFRRGQCSVDRAPAVVSVAPPAPRPVHPSPSQKSGADAAREEKLAALRETLSKAEEAADADYRLQSAKLKLEEMAKKLESLEDINLRYSDMQENLAALKGCDTLPADLPELLSTHLERQTQKMAKSDELQHDIESLKMQIEHIPTVSLVLNKLFLVGALLGILSLAAGLFVPIKELETYFPIGILVSLILIAAGWYNSSRRGAQRKVLHQEVEGLERDLAELEKSFEQGGSQILAAMQATESATVEELRDKYDNFRHFRSLLDDIDQQRTMLLGGIPYDDLMAEYHRQQQENIELEKAMSAIAQYAVDTYSVRQEIDRIESEMTGITFDFGAPEPEPAAHFSAPHADEAPRQGAPLAEISVASRVSGIELETLIPAIEAAAQRNLSAVTGGRYVRIEVGHEGNPAVHDRQNTRIPFQELSHSTREAAYFCLRTGLIEAVAGKLRLPFLVDDALTGFDPARQQAACQVLRGLGAKSQVILFTSNSGLRAAGDAVAELK